MTIWTFLGGLAMTTYLIRFGGIALATRDGSKAEPKNVSSAGMTALLPVALLAAVAATQVAPKGHLEPHLMFAAVAAGTVSRRLGFLPSVLIGGLTGMITALL